MVPSAIQLREEFSCGEVVRPHRVERICLSFDLDVSDDLDVHCLDQFRPTLGNRKDPVSRSSLLKILLVDPALSFLGVSFLKPGPQLSPDDMIDF